MPLVACDRSANQAPGVVCGVAVIGGFWLLCNLALGNWFVCCTQAHEKWINVSLPRVTIKTDKWGSLRVCQRSNCERLLCISAWCSVITLLWPDGEPSLTCADERPVCDVCWCLPETGISDRKCLDDAFSWWQWLPVMLRCWCRCWRWDDTEWFTTYLPWIWFNLTTKFWHLSPYFCRFVLGRKMS